jgi:hypothetical protein
MSHIETEKVEVGFDLTSGAGPFLRLDDPVSGKLDDPDWTLGGTIFYDITDRVRSFSVSRGRSSLFDQFPAGQAYVEFNNHDRAFDPIYSSSPFFGNIIPNREIRITSGTVVQFTGWIDDWNLTYSPDGNSIAEAIATDATRLLARRTLSAGTPSVESTGARINSILSSSDVQWSNELRAIDTGAAELSDYPITEGSNALNYLQQVSKTEPGNLFIGKTGFVTFQDRTVAPTTDSLVYLGGTGIPMANIEVVYGSENLYNEIALSRLGGGTAIVTDTDSIGEYGQLNLTQDDLLYSDDSQLVETALDYAVRYSQPEYRFNTVEVQLHKLTPSQQAEMHDIEIGSVCQVTFTPNGIGDPIERYVEVIKVQHIVTPEEHTMMLGFRSLDFASIVLDDAEFGKLDVYSLSW